MSPPLEPRIPLKPLNAERRSRLNCKLLPLRTLPYRQQKRIMSKKCKNLLIFPEKKRSFVIALMMLMTCYPNAFVA